MGPKNMPAKKMGTASSEKRVDTSGIGIMSLANTTLMAARTADTTRVLTFLSECACVRATAADWFLDIKIASESK